jgi:EmrB/QacA subfamily drug resistance transporter
VLLWSASTAAFLNILDGSAVNVALPVILSELGADTGEGVWVILAYSTMLASTVLLFGQLSDRFGPHRILAGGFAAFTLTSAACGLAPGLQSLIAARWLQGIAGGALSATSMSIVGHHVPPEERGRAIGLLSASAAMGSLLGAPLGGLLSATLGWRWVFYINLPIGVVACLGLYWAQITHPSRQGPWRPDVLGALLSTAGIASLAYAISASSQSPWDSPNVYAAALCSALILGAFCLWERRCSFPLLDLELLGKASFRHANAANFFASAFVAGITFLMPFYLRYVQQLSPSQTGLSLLAMGAVYVLVSLRVASLADRFGATFLTTGSALSAALTMLIFAYLAGRQAMAWPLLALMLTGLCYGLYLTPNNRRILSLAPIQRQGAASGILRLLFYLGQVAGVAAIESLFGRFLPEGAGKLAELPPSSLLPAFQAGLVTCALLMGLCAVFSWRSGRTSGGPADALTLVRAGD